MAARLTASNVGSLLRFREGVNNRSTLGDVRP
jgi:hypothetical protein